MFKQGSTCRSESLLGAYTYYFDDRCAPNVFGKGHAIRKPVFRVVCPGKPNTNTFSLSNPQKARLIDTHYYILVAKSNDKLSI